MLRIKYWFLKVLIIDEISMIGRVNYQWSITAGTKRFPLKKGKVLLLLKKRGHAVTVNKSHGSTLAYIQDDVNRSTRKKTSVGKNYQQSISQGQFYILLSSVKSGFKVLLLNFEPEDIKVNESVLEEMIRMMENRKSHYFPGNTP